MLPIIPNEQLEAMQKFAELGRLSASLLHEISNPLAAALLHLELDDQRSAGVRRAHKDLQLVKRYIEAARQQLRGQGALARFCIQTQLDELAQIVVPMARRAGIRLHLEKTPLPKMYGDPVKFQQIVANLLVNAIEACEEAGNKGAEPTVKLSISFSKPWLTLKVVDQGRGINPVNNQQIFDPFFTTKGLSGKGLGIGLSTVKQYVTTSFQGSINVNSSQSGGATFIVKLHTKPKPVNQP